MSLSTAINTAGTGLAANARSVEVVSANIANALTPGYAPRAAILTASSLGGIGGGVRFVGVERQLVQGLAALHRDAAAEKAGTSTLASHWQTLETAIGAPGEARSLSARIDAFETALIEAAARPDLEDRLAAVVGAGQTLSRTMAGIETRIQQARTEADQGIALSLRSLSEGLAQVHALNRQVRVLQATGQSPLALLDDRDALVARIAEIVPLREVARADGTVALYSKGGALLLDTAPATLEFTPTPVIGPGATVAGGQLSGLMLNGHPVAGLVDGQLGGGRLGALFAIRDRDAPAAQAAVDTIARDLITRFQDPATDPSALPGTAALFTDAGSALAPPGPAGLAGRLALNPVVIPDQGGALWRLRDGLGAAAPGPVGDASQIERWRAALERALSPDPGLPATTFAHGAARLLSSLSQSRQSAEDRAQVSASVHQQIEAQRLASGVDTDAEMQRLLLIEQAYTANSRVIQVADEMLRRLLEI